MQLEVAIDYTFRLGDIDTHWVVHVTGMSDGIDTWDLELVDAVCDCGWVTAAELEALVRRDIDVVLARARLAIYALAAAEAA